MKRNNPRTQQSKPFGASVFVKNDDVNGALRRLKKILEADNRQKVLSQKEYFEKPSVSRKRAKDQARKRTKKDQLSENSILTAQKPTGTKWMKSKRKRRKVLDKEQMLANVMRKKAKRK